MIYKNLNITVVPIDDYQIKNTRFLAVQNDFEKYCEFLNPPVNFFDEIHIENDVAAVNKPNIFIQYMNWALRQREEIFITVYSRNYWVFHDIKHAEIHSDGFRVFTVDAEAEDEANAFALEQLKECGMYNDFVGEELELYKKTFKKRFGIKSKVL